MFIIIYFVDTASLQRHHGREVTQTTNTHLSYTHMHMHAHKLRWTLDFRFSNTFTDQPVWAVYDNHTHSPRPTAVNTHKQANRKHIQRRARDRHHRHRHRHKDTDTKTHSHTRASNHFTNTRLFSFHRLTRLLSFHALNTPFFIPQTRHERASPFV